MKHIIVAGAPRSGKTTLSRKLICPGYVHYRLDSIIRAFFKNFPPEYKDWHKASKLTVQVIKQLVDDNEQESIRKEYFIFDSPHLYPEDVASFDTNQFLIIFLGYTDIDVQTKTDAILAYDAKTCWTHKLPREELAKLVDGNIKFSKEIEAQCKAHDILYFDVSNNPEATLQKVREYILQNV